MGTLNQSVNGSKTGIPNNRATEISFLSCFSRNCIVIIKHIPMVL